MTHQLAIIFPGQGSQSLGMLSELAKHNDIVHQTFDQASAGLGYDLWELVQHGSITQLDQTEYTQPAMLAAGVAVYRVWQSETEIEPLLLAGHSLGEYSAWVCAGSIQFSDAVRLAAKRGELMQEAMPGGLGAMAAIIGLNDEQVLELCQQASTDEYWAKPANFNAVGQVVIAGHTPAIEKAMTLADEQGARMAKKIAVSVPCHSDLLKPAAEKFADFFAKVTVNSPNIPVISNVDASQPKEADHIREMLIQQLYKPVQWVNCIQQFSKAAIDIVLECGPGRVLTGLNKRIDRQLTSYPVYDPTTLKAAHNACSSD